MTRAFHTVKDLAARLQVKDKTIYAWVSQGKIPCVKVNGVIRFDPEDIEHWLQHCHVPIGLPRLRGRHRRREELWWYQRCRKALRPSKASCLRR